MFKFCTQVHLNACIILYTLHLYCNTAFIFAFNIKVITLYVTGTLLFSYFLLGTHHWVCASRHCHGSSVCIMDSKVIFHQITKSTQLQIARIFNPPQGSRSLRLEIVPVQQQDGVHDCGLFAIAYGTEECLGRRPESANFEQALMRQHLIKCLQKESFDPFPRASLPSILPQLNSVFKLIKLYCICHMPDHFDEKMICCDECNEWFHFSCVCEGGADLDLDTWMCPHCSRLST